MVSGVPGLGDFGGFADRTGSPRLNLTWPGEPEAALAV